jgi:hypothetical protein
MWLEKKTLTKDNLVHKGSIDISCVFCGAYENTVANLIWTWITNHNSFTF